MKNLNTFLIINAFVLLLSYSSICQDSELASLENFIQNYTVENHKPGFAACIIKNDSVYWNGNFGFANLTDSIPVTDSTLFNAMSISKTFASVCIMQLWEDGLIEMDENINNCLPFQIDNPYLESDSITIRFLMTHSSCIIDNNFLAYITVGDPTIQLGDFLEDYLSPGGQYYNSGNFLNQTQGTIPAYNYTNIGMGLTGYLVEVLTPMSFKEYSIENLLAPLEMSHAGWFLADLNLDNLAIGYEYNAGQFQSYPHYGVPFYPGMSLRTNVKELSHFVLMMLNRGEYLNNMVIEPETADSMSSLQLNFNYTGLGLRRETINCITGPKIIWGHKGGGSYGYAAEFQMCKDENTAILYMSNSSVYAEPIVKRMLEYAAMIVIADDANEISEDGFLARWQEAPDAGSYLIDLAYDENFNNILEDYENFYVGADTSFQFTGLDPDTDYYYRLRGINEYDTGAYSNIVYAQTLSSNPIVNYVDDSFYSEVLQYQVNVKIYLPPDYNSSPDIYYPVIYHLHGYGINQNSLLFYAPTANTLIDSAVIDPFIIVCPNNQAGPFSGTMYMNSPLWGDYVTCNFEELVNFVEENYRAIPDKNKRALMGQSMGAFGCFENGPSNKDKFRAIAAHGYAGVFEACLDNWQSQVIGEQSAGPPYFYDFYSGGFMTKLGFLVSGAYAPNQNSSQAWINPPIVDFVYDDQGEYIDTVLSKWLGHSGHQLVKQLNPSDEFGILFGCGENDNLGFYPGSVALKDSLESYGIPFRFIQHNGGHGMPLSFMREAYIFLDSIFNMTATGIEETICGLDVSVSPNPMIDHTRVILNSVHSGPVELTLYDMTGTCLKKEFYRANLQGIKLDMRNFPKGLYICRIMTGNKTVTKKIIKQ
jgi:CubicO group peptidase (beta-lactamase class C family)/S-formylglutathione hydrolase FrmB